MASESSNDGNLRAAIVAALSAREIRATPQALNALLCSVSTSSPELAGDSDSLLLGLLSSGSYTVDLLRDAGASIEELSLEAAVTAREYYSPVSGVNIDPVETLFGEQGNFARLLEREEFKQRPIEAGDLLQEAICPLADEDDRRRNWLIPQIKATLTEQVLRVSDEIQVVVADALDTFCREIWKNPVRALQERSHPLTAREIAKIPREEFALSDSELECVVRGINGFIQERVLPLHDRQFVGLGVEFADPTIGSGHFTSGGGDYSRLSLSLSVANRYAPERDEPILSLIEVDGRICAQYFSYRGTGFVENQSVITPLSFNAPVQLPLIPGFVLREFEALINNSRTGELDIQRFLERNPEILKSLGYADCQPHVVLREPGRSDLIPDFLLHRPGNAGFDILDLKLPTAVVARQNPYPRISQNITKAIGQLRAYRNYFKSPANRDRFVREYGMECLEPKLIVAIGRQDQYPGSEFREEILQQTSDIKILTYDEVIAYATTRTLNGLPR